MHWFDKLAIRFPTLQQNRQWTYLTHPLSLWWKFISFTVIFSLSALIIEIANFQVEPNILYYTSSRTDQSKAVRQESGLTGDRIEISKIGVAAPLVFDVNGLEEKKYLKSLEQGVAHMLGTPKPGEEGNVFIFGHSDHYKESKYKDVFKRLNELARDDEIHIIYKDKVYI